MAVNGSDAQPVHRVPTSEQVEAFRKEWAEPPEAPDWQNYLLEPSFREQAALAFANTLLTNVLYYTRGEDPCQPAMDLISDEAVIWTDALIAALEATPAQEDNEHELQSSRSTD